MLAHRRLFGFTVLGFVCLVVLVWVLLPRRYVAALRAGPFERRVEDKALIEAIAKQDLTELKRLLDHGSNPDSVIGAKESEGRTALQVAAGTGNLRLVQLLLD